jgi:hypothetical protein
VGRAGRVEVQDTEDRDGRQDTIDIRRHRESSFGFGFGRSSTNSQYFSYDSVLFTKPAAQIEPVTL